MVNELNNLITGHENPWLTILTADQFKTFQHNQNPFIYHPHITYLTFHMATIQEAFQHYLPHLSDMAINSFI
jgi:hypothetical protein